MDEAIQGLTEINSWSSDFNTTSFNVAGYIAAAILAVSLVFVVWALSTKKDNARTYLLAWFIALIFTITFIIK